MSFIVVTTDMSRLPQSAVEVPEAEVEAPAQLQVNNFPLNGSMITCQKSFCAAEKPTTLNLGCLAHPH